MNLRQVKLRKKHLKKYLERSEIKMNKRKLYYLLFLVTLFSCSVTSIITVAEEIGSTDESLLIKDITLESSETIESSSSLEENEPKSSSNSIEETELPTKNLSKKLGYLE